MKAIEMRSSTLQTIAKLTFPDYKGDEFSIALADKNSCRDDTSIPCVAWLVDLTKIEAAGPNETVSIGPSEVLPISSGVPILPTQSAQIVARGHDEFRPTRFIISSAGTSGGAADWIVNDILIGGRSQFIESGDVPGDLFAADTIDGRADIFVAFVEAALPDTDVVVIVTYIGPNEDGAPFFGAMIGSRYERKPEYVRVPWREAVSSTRAQISFGFALVTQSFQDERDGRHRDSPKLTIYVPAIDQATIDVAVDAVLASGTTTKEVHKMIGNVLGDYPALVHATYVALVEQRANELAVKEARASSPILGILEERSRAQASDIEVEL